MTTLQKDTIIKLLIGYTIAASGANGYRLRSPQAHVCRKISVKTFQRLHSLLRKNKGVFVINKHAVRKLHGKTFIKKEYRLLNSKL